MKNSKLGTPLNVELGTATRPSQYFIELNKNKAYRIRRGVGVGAVRSTALAQSTFSTAASALESQSVSSLTAQLAQFKKSLEMFATKYKAEINANPIFRGQFSSMCMSVGV